MVESGKKRKMSIWVTLSIIFYCLIIVIITVVIEQKMNPIRQNETTSDTVDQTILTVFNTSVKPYIAGSRQWEIIGEIKNNDKLLYYDASFTINIYGQNNELIASVKDLMPKIKPGETRPFHTYSFDDISNYKDIKVHFDRLDSYR